MALTRTMFRAPLQAGVGVTTDRLLLGWEKGQGRGLKDLKGAIISLSAAAAEDEVCICDAPLPPDFFAIPLATASPFALPVFASLFTPLSRPRFALVLAAVFQGLASRRFLRVSTARSTFFTFSAMMCAWHSC